MQILRERVRSRLTELPVATLLLFSVAACLAPAPWQCARHVEAASLLRVDPAAEAGSSLRSGQPVRLPFAPDGSRSNRGVVLRGRSWIDVSLPETLRDFELVLQSGAASATRVLASPDGERWSPLWSLAPRSDVEGLATLRSPRFVRSEDVRFLRIHPEVGQTASISGLRVESPGLAVQPIGVAVALWLAAAALVLGRRLGRVSGLCDALLRGWRRVDLWLATPLIYLCFFRAPGPVLAAGLLLALVLGLVVAVRRAPVATLAVLALVGLVFFVALPRAFESVVISQIAATHELDIDHRMKPDGAEINADGIRFRGSGEDLPEDAFTVAFLGDSFTYGWGLAYQEAYPYVFEQIVARWSCAAPVRAVDMGWTSASPLLALRLLREIGYRYQPDLVVYSLDMTDFQDDLRYEWRLRERGDFELDRSEIVSRFVAMNLPFLRLDATQIASIGELLRGTREDEERIPVDVPPHRYFVTEAPLEETRAAIERGVMSNLAALHAFAADSLDARMALVVYPRAFQYSDVEAARSWDRDSYSVLGPFAREPFRYFSEVGSSLPYPVLSLLPAFEASKQFPLFREEDPHWNAAGARLAAASVAGELASRGLIPCEAPER